MNTYQDLFNDDFAVKDDIDELFSHLEQFHPPVDMLNRVMQAVAQLPLPQIREPLDELEALA